MIKSLKYHLHDIERAKRNDFNPPASLMVRRGQEFPRFKN